MQNAMNSIKILQNSLTRRPYRGYKGLRQTKRHKWLTLASQRRGHPGNPFRFVNSRQGLSFASSHSSSVPPHPFITAFWWATDPTDHLATTPSVLHSRTSSKHTVNTLYMKCPEETKKNYNRIFPVCMPFILRIKCNLRLCTARIHREENGCGTTHS